MMPTVIETMQPGERVTYYRGSNLARARLDGPIEAADATWESALRGEVSLVQRRRANGEIDYIAIKRRVADRSPVKPATVTQSFKRAA